MQDPTTNSKMVLSIWK